MRSEIRVVAENGQEFRFDLEHATPMSNQQGRDWLDAEFIRMECEPLRPTGKLLLADKVVVVARAAGAGLLAMVLYGKYGDHLPLNRQSEGFAREGIVIPFPQRVLHQAEALRQSILKQAFAGKLVPQNAADEPAEVLLERIKRQ